MCSSHLFPFHSNLRKNTSHYYANKSLEASRNLTMKLALKMMERIINANTFDNQGPAKKLTVREKIEKTCKL